MTQFFHRKEREGRQDSLIRVYLRWGDGQSDITAFAPFAAFAVHFGLGARHV
jgi:hypothetical protein